MAESTVLKISWRGLQVEPAAIASANLTLTTQILAFLVRRGRLTKAEVEGFMEWVSERQYNRGPIFYCLKTVSGGVEVNDFINYYSIKSVAVNDSVP